MRFCKLAVRFWSCSRSAGCRGGPTLGLVLIDAPRSSRDFLTAPSLGTVAPTPAFASRATRSWRRSTTLKRSGAERREILPVVGDRAGLRGAPGRVGLRVEVHEHLPSAELLEPDRVSVLIQERERRREVSGLEDRHVPRVVEVPWFPIARIPTGSA